MSYFLQNFKLLPYKNLAPFILSIFFIVSCGDGNDENIAPIEVIMSASSEEVEYEEGRDGHAATPTVGGRFPFGGSCLPRPRPPHHHHHDLLRTSCGVASFFRENEQLFC